jgi:hypothetical protein
MTHLKTLLIAGLFFVQQLHAQQSNVFYEDIPRFWAVYDSLHTLTDSTQQIQLIQQQYLDKGTDGLKELATLRHWTPEKFRKSILEHPGFWSSIRPKTLEVQQNIPLITKLMERYQLLYKDFKIPDVYFIIGYIGTGGTTTQVHILIGTEIAVGDSTTDATGLHPFLTAFMYNSRGVAHLVAHEITHTQQKGGDMEENRKGNLLGFCLGEGMCDFMAELLLEQPLQTPYITYGEKHKKELWKKFKQEMHGLKTDDWLYNGASKPKGDADLGYYIGYVICKSYYNHAKDKSTAIHDIITLDLENVSQLDQFLKNAGYTP